MSTLKLFPATSSLNHRFHLLDALRGIAAVLVVLVHVPIFIYPRGTHVSFLAVDFFFCLSGFVIAHSYERRLQSSLTVKAFLVARVIRLYPVYIVGTVCGMVVFAFLDYHHMPHPPSAFSLTACIAAQVLMLPNYIRPIAAFAYPFDLAAWSLFFEVGANLLYALLVRKGFSKNRYLGIILLGGILFFFVFRHAHPLDLGVRSTFREAGFAVARVTVSFTLGVFMLRLYRRSGSRISSPLLSNIALLLLPVLLIVLLQSPFAFLRTPRFEFMDVLVLFPVIVFLGAHVRTPSAWVALCAFAGDTSYPLYLLHVPVIRVGEEILSRAHLIGSVPGRPSTSLLTDFVYLTAVISISIAAGALVNRYIDKPARTWLRNISTSAPGA